MGDSDVVLQLVTALQEAQLLLLGLIGRGVAGGRQVAAGAGAWHRAMSVARRHAQKQLSAALTAPHMSFERVPRGRRFQLTLPGPPSVSHQLAMLEGWRVRTGPVLAPMALIDGSSVMLDGPPGPGGVPTVWWTDSKDVTRSVRSVTTMLSGLSSAEPAGRLTTRPEVDLVVLRGLAEGWTNSRIARALSVSERTATARVLSACAGLGVSDRLEALRLLAPLAADRTPAPTEESIRAATACAYG